MASDVGGCREGAEHLRSGGSRHVVNFETQMKEVGVLPLEVETSDL